MTGVFVFVRPEPVESRNRQIGPSAAHHKTVDFSEERAVIFNVLDNIEQSDCGQNLREELGVFQSRPNDMAYTPVQGVSRSRESRFHKNDLEPSVLKRSV